MAAHRRPSTTLLLVALLALCADRCLGRMSTAATANPIRRVVNMLQAMQSKIQAEGKKEEELYEKFQCYCKTGGESLSASVEAAKTKIPTLESDIEKASAQKTQLKSGIAKATTDRKAAMASMREAAALRDKEADAFHKESTETKANIKSMGSAIEALEKGMAGSFLQTQDGARLALLVKQSSSLSDGDRETVTAFLSGEDSASEAYAPASGEIVGILKQMKETTEKDLEEMEKTEKDAIADFEKLWDAKKSEVKSLVKAAEKKTARLGKVSTDLVNMIEDLDDTKKGLADDIKFLADLGKNCATKKEEWAARSKTRSDELLALADTIKILNDDDALDLFKKTLPSTSLLQVQVSSRDVMRHARQVLGADMRSDSRLDFISLAMQGKKTSFDKLAEMIDKLAIQLGKEQVDDDKKKEYCTKELEVSEDETKAMLRKKKELETAISEGEGAIASLKEEISSLTASIKDTDKKVEEATELRKQEHQEYKEERAANTAAKKIILMAKGRMDEFYKKKASLMQVSSHRDLESDALAPPPETFDAYTTKGAEASKVTTMMEFMAEDLEKEIVDGEKEEKDSQAGYEKFVADSAEKRSTTTEEIKAKERAKAEAEETVLKSKAMSKAETRKLMGQSEYVKNLHSECDWLLENFDVRMKARRDEVESLKRAKSVVLGADFD